MADDPRSLLDRWATAPTRQGPADELDRLAAELSPEIDRPGYERPPTGMDRLQQAEGAALRGAAESTALMLEGPAIAMEQLPAWVPARQQAPALRALATGARQVGTLIPPAEQQSLRESFFGSTVPGAVGSSAPFLVGGALGVAGGVPAALTTASLGASAGAAAQYNDAEAAGAAEDQKWAAYLGGAAVGTTEAVPLARMLNRVDRGSGGALRQLLVDGMVEGVEEAAQEAFQSTAANLIAAHIADYDEDRELLEGVIEGGSAGFFSGLLLSALFSAGAAGRTPPPSLADETAPRGPESPENLTLAPEIAVTPRGAPSRETLAEEGAPDVGAPFGPGFPQGERGAEPSLEDMTVEEMVAQIEAESEAEERTAKIGFARAPEPAAPTAFHVEHGVEGLAGTLLRSNRAEGQAVEPEPGSAAEAARDFLAARGVSATFVDAGEPLARPGTYRAGEAVLDVRQAPEALHAVVFHELAHHVQETAGESWEGLYAEIERLDAEGLELARREYGARAEAEGLTLTPERSEEEAGAFYVESIGGYLQAAFADPGRLARLSETREGRTLLERILDALVAFVDRLKGTPHAVPRSARRKLEAARRDLARTRFERRLSPDLAARLALRARNALNATLDLRTPAVADQSQTSRRSVADQSQIAVLPGPMDGHIHTFSPGDARTSVDGGHDHTVELRDGRWVIGEADGHSHGVPEEAQPTGAPVVQRGGGTEGAQGGHKGGTEKFALAAQRPGPRRRAREAALFDRGFDLPTEGLLAAVQRRVQDYFSPVERWQRAVERQGGDIPETADPTLAFRLWRGRAGERVRQFERTHVEPIVEVIREGGLAQEDVYQFLRARHAEERNEAIAQIRPGVHNGSGMSTQEAQRLLEGFESGPDADAYRRLGLRWDRMNRQKLRMMVDDGLVTPEEASALRAKYKRWAPLRTLPPEEIAFTGIGRGVDIRGREFQRAFGRTTPGESPLEFGFASFATAILRGEKNHVGQAMLEAVERNPDPSFALVDEPEVRMVIGPDGLARRAYDPTYKLADDVYSVKRGGIEHHITFQEGHELLPRALKNASLEHGPEVVQALGWMSRMVARLATQWNPVFPVFNMLRDAQGMVVTAGGEQGFGFARRAFTDIPAAMVGIVSEMRNPGAGVGEYAQAWREYQEDGGRISFLDLNNVHDEIRRVRRAVARTGPVSSTRSIEWLRTLGDAIGAYNDVVENGTRLAVYYQLRENRGWSRARAAEYAKGITTNFETKGEIGPWLNSLWAFSNAGIQGLSRHGFRAMRHPRVRAEVAAATLFAAGWAMIARLLMGDDEYDAIPEHEKRQYFILPTGWLTGEPEDRITIPLPFVFRWFNYAGSKMGELAGGDAGAGEVVGDTIGGLVDEVNPLGESGHPAQAVSPTGLDPFVQMWINRDWSGRPIYPTQFPGQVSSDAALHWPDASEASKHLARFVNEATGGDEVEGGMVDVSPESLDHLAKFATGGTGTTLGRVQDVFAKWADPDEPVRISDIPLARRLWRRRSPYYTAKRYREISDEVKKLEARSKRHKAAGDSDKLAEIRSDPLWSLRDALKRTDREVSKRMDAIDATEDAVERQRLEAEVEELRQRVIERAP